MGQREDEMYRQGRPPEQVERTAQILTWLGGFSILMGIIVAIWIGFNAYSIFLG